MADKNAKTGQFGAWWSVPGDELARRTETSTDRGLSGSQVDQHRQQYGSNQIESTGPAGLWTLLWESIKSPMIVLLLVIAAISLVLRQYREAIVMVFVVAMYIAVHLLNKSRADRTMARLREVQAPKARVLRDGQIQEVRVEDVVVGDVLPLLAGTRVAADGRLIQATSLTVNEGALTGESAPVTKDAGADVAADSPLAERATAVWAGTTVLDGQARALVMAVGNSTEFGRVAEMATRASSEKTPLQKEMDSLAHTLAIAAIVISLLIPLLGLLRGLNLQEMLLTWLSLTFLMVPGQPPIIISMALALASLELARKGVIVRRLEGAETLGAVTVMLSDKTGTLTENKMALSGILLPDGRQIPVDGSGGTNGHGNGDGQKQREQLEFLQAAAQAVPENATDPTDVAVAEAARQVEGGQPPERGQLVNQVGFSRSNTYRALEYAQGAQHRIFVTGRPEYVIDRSQQKQSDGGATPWDAGSRRQAQTQIEELAAQGRRISAYGYTDRPLEDQEPSDLVYVGAAVLSDPIRPEVKDAVTKLHGAGIRVAMVTGDIPQTAAYVAREVGIDGDRTVTGKDLEGRSEDEYEDLARTAQVYARTTPEEKLHLVEALKRLGETVAVTGDGVNDAPALRTAHVGIAMGQRGTDVAKETADLILTDDSFAHLPDGVAVGRKAYDNFRKGITYYLSAKAILLVIFLIPLIAGTAFPLAPIQIIFTELLMDLASSTIFVTEAAEPDLLKRKPRPRARFLSWQVAGQIARNAAGPVAAIIAVYLSSLALGYGVDNARTAAWATWLLGHILLAMNLKQTDTPLLKQGLLSNRFAFGWLLGMIVLVLAMTFVPAVQTVLKTTPLSGIQWVGVVLGAILASGWIEVRKWMHLAARREEVGARGE